jgi:hypothetical protein
MPRDLICNVKLLLDDGNDLPELVILYDLHEYVLLDEVEYGDDVTEIVLLKQNSQIGDEEVLHQGVHTLRG